MAERWDVLNVANFAANFLYFLLIFWVNHGCLAEFADVVYGIHFELRTVGIYIIYRLVSLGYFLRVNMSDLQFVEIKFMYDFNLMSFNISSWNMVNTW